MRRNLLVAVIVGTGLSLSMWVAAAAQGQAGRPNSSGGTTTGSGQGGPSVRPSGATGAEVRVALVDIAYIFKKYDKFTKLSEQMKADVKAREGEMIQAQNELKGLMTQRSQLNPDTPTYKDIDQKVATRKANLELMSDGARREFTQREASIYHQTYQEVEAAIKRYAQSNGITLVLRASRDEDVSVANPQDVIKEVSQQVIYAVPQMDITEDILAMLNPASTASQPKNSKPGGTPPTGLTQPPKVTNKPGNTPIKK